MSLFSELQRFDGIMSTATLRNTGQSRRQIEHAISAGVIHRIRPGWVALPTADPMLVLAAKRAVTLTCLTRARRLGLWVFAEKRTHVASKPHGRGISDPRFVVHWHAPLEPRDPNRLEDTLVNTLVLVAACVPHEEAVAIWDSALNKRLTDIHRLKQLRLPTRARRVLADATPLSDSGIETYLRQRLKWLQVPLKLQVMLSGHRVDGLLGERLVLQVDGGHHVGLQRDVDNAHDLELQLCGYTVIRISYRQLIYEWPLVQDRITSAMANGLHHAR
jgi:very-short-patch-repair endonuclease